jgi:tetratricopeptide (TPR) repeat protein
MAASMNVTTNTRREKLEAFVAANPSDAFARYGLALECARLADHTAAEGHFKQLLDQYPSYVAAYYQYGQFLTQLGRNDEAKRILSSGIVVAQKAGDAHARDEMQAALSALA